MTKSRKQKLKKLDFKKKKLKVGKAQTKPSNITDTSFVARTINIKNQHLEHDNDLSRRLPLLKHHNVTVRKETLQIFQKSLPSIIDTRLMTPLLTQCIPMIVDDSRMVRTAFMELIDEIGNRNEQVLRLHCKIFVLYISMSMTHIIPSIQADSTRLLGVLLRYCGDEICRQSWTKLLGGILSVLGWGEGGKNQASGTLQTRKRDSKTTIIHLDTLFEFIKCGCTEPKVESEVDNENEEGGQISEVKNQYIMADYPQPYEYLKLFVKQLKKKNSTGSRSDTTATTTSLSSQDIEARQQILKEQFLETIEKQIDHLVKEGGEAGKNANNLKQLLVSIF